MKQNGAKNIRLGKSQRVSWNELSAMFKYPPEIRKLIYTTNAIEDFNRQLRTATKTKSAFVSDDALMKILYLTALQIVDHGRSYKSSQPQLSEKQIKYLLSQYCRKSGAYSEQYNRDMIDCFIHAVHLYEDKICITYNLVNQDNSMLQSTIEIVNNPANTDKYSILRGSYKDCDGGR